MYVIVALPHDRGFHMHIAHDLSLLAADSSEDVTYPTKSRALFTLARYMAKNEYGKGSTIVSPAYGCENGHTIIRPNGQEISIYITDAA